MPSKKKGLNDAQRAMYCVLPRGGSPSFGWGARWSTADLLFLRDTLRRGLSFAEVANFLGRTEDEVREKATEPQS
jgi:hypothetical protein